jgi:Mn2+/Fe2+ NRAMP family transporter
MSFDVSRLRRCDWMVGGGAVAFLVFLFFFDWYGGSYKGTIPVGGGSFGVSVSSTGWDTFTNSRWIWLLTILVSIAAVALVAGQRKLDLPVRLSTVVLGLGALSTLLVLYRIVHHPSGGASFAGASFSYGIKIGIWLGLIAAAVIAYGGYLMMSEEDSSPELGGYRPPASSSLSTPPTPPAAPPAAAAAESPLPPSAPSGTGL